MARQLASPEMSDGYGLRTMSAANGGFQPLSYHCGSIWPHDTAIVAAGLAEAGFDTESAQLIDGLLAAAEAFDYRLPEVYGGDSRDALARPVPYPAACHPQAWSAAAAITITRTALGLAPDVPGGGYALGRWRATRSVRCASTDCGSPVSVSTWKSMRPAGNACRGFRPASR